MIIVDNFIVLFDYFCKCVINLIFGNMHTYCIEFDNDNNLKYMCDCNLCYMFRFFVLLMTKKLKYKTA